MRWVEDHPYLGLAAMLLLAAFLFVVAEHFDQKPSYQETWEVESARR
jgi:hypothetical protein